MDASTRFGRALLRLLQVYLKHTPILYGKTRLMSWGGELLGTAPRLAHSYDDRRFRLQFPRDHGWEHLYFTGTFETGTTELLRRVLRPDDITFDIGANIGWYTTLFAMQCPRGHCHAFEPAASVCAQLVANCELNGVLERVTPNSLGVGEQPGVGTLYHFAELPHSHSSMSPKVGHAGRPVACELTTLDSYCAEHRIDRVDLVKVDVEGAEMSVLKGAHQVFSLDPPPLWLVEINVETSRAFGYTPEAMLRFLGEQGDMDLYRVIRGWGAFVPVRDLAECGHGDNVLCVPRERLARVAGLV